MTTIVWFRSDLRIADHAALCAACERRGPVVPVFIWAPEEESPWPPGAAARWWLHHALVDLAEQLQRLGSPLIVRRGPTEATLEALVSETGATAVYWSRRYEPAIIERDTRLKQNLIRAGVTATSFNASLLVEPWEMATKQGGPFQVFSPFWRACLATVEPRSPVAAPTCLIPPVNRPASLDIAELQLLPRIGWDSGIRSAWEPTSTGAQQTLERFVAATVEQYGELRNRPDLDGVSRLSPYLRCGQLSPQQVWSAVAARHLPSQKLSRETGADVFLSEIGWREFAYHLIYHFPTTPERPLRPKYEAFPWRDEPSGLQAWQRGQTGFPMVDAGMRQLWSTGWMHNRVRMIAASFLVKDLLIGWTAGSRWFWDTLVDADLASNTLGWQWTAGCGADAAPYFRIFNPTSQGEKFDPDGTYVRRWVPELARLPSTWIHRPHEAPTEVLNAAGVKLGIDYPRPIVDHAEARDRALAALASLKAD